MTSFPPDALSSSGSGPLHAAASDTAGRGAAQWGSAGRLLSHYRCDQALTRLWPGSDQAVTTAADADGFLDLSQDLLRSAAATCWLSSLYELINTQLRQLIRPLSQIQLDTDTDWEFLHLVAIFDDQLANKSEMIFLQSFWRYKVLVENFEKLQKIFYFYLIT